MPIKTPIKPIWSIFIIAGITMGQEILFPENISETAFSNIFKSAGYPAVGDIPMLNRKIFKGNRVTVQEHPYVVSIRRLFSHYLTGTLLTKQLVITVAHPLYKVPIYELGVVAGETYSDRGTTMRSIVIVVVHEDFDPYTLVADIAFLRLYEEIVFKISVKPIELIAPSSTITDERVFVTGWGRCDLTGKELCLPRATKYFPDEKIDPMMRTISFVIKSPNYYCEGYERHETSLGPGMLCLGEAREENPVAPCLAVPGAPLVINAHLAGFQSWGFGCGYNNDLPLVYTDVRYYQPWIIHNVPILRKLTKNNLTDMFQATKAHTLSEWLRLTRQNIEHQLLKKNITKSLLLTNLDKELGKLKGFVFDIRDFLNNGEFHELKTKTMENLKNETSKLHNGKSFFNFTTVTTRPFLNISKLANEQYAEEQLLLENEDRLNSQDYREYYIDTLRREAYNDDNVA